MQTHPLLKQCSRTLKAVVLGLGCLVVWGAMFPMALFAQTNPQASLGPMPTTTFSWGDHRPPMSESTSSDKMMPPRGREEIKGKEHNNEQGDKKESMMFKNQNSQRMAKRKVQALVTNLKQFQKQINSLSEQGVTVPTTLSSDIQKVIDDIKELNDSIAQSKVSTSPPTPVVTETSTQ